MHTIVVSLQTEDWDDDGGDHDPFIVTVTTDELTQIKSEKILLSSDPLYQKLLAATPIHPPVQVEWVGTVWTAYG